MSNRMKVRKPKVSRKLRCPQCRSKECDVKEYDDAHIYICRKCFFPRRVLR